MLDDAREAFLTGSVMGVMPLTRLDGRPIGSGGPGPTTRAIRRLYDQAVARETARSGRRRTDAYGSRFSYQATSQ